MPISNTPFPIYQWIRNNANAFSRWEQFQFVLMDKQVTRNRNDMYCYLKNTDAASFERKITEIFLDPLAKKTEAVGTYTILKPVLSDFASFDAHISSHGGIDLLILALGESGHYAQVMPGTTQSGIGQTIM